MTADVFQASQAPSMTSHPTLYTFERIVKRYFFLHTAFMAFACLLVVLFVAFFSFFEQSFLMGIVLAFFFFSFVIYFILRTYVKEQKPRQLIAICTEYMKSCLAHTKESSQLAHEAYEMAKRLDNVAPLLYTLPSSLQLLEPYFRPFCAFCFWQDVHQMKELFLLTMIDELKNCVKAAPLSPEAHRNLASGYLILFSHYNEPLQKSSTFMGQTKGIREELQTKARYAADRAVEECLILREYTPKDPWVHKHLGLVYKDLGLAEKEIEAFEAIVQLEPNDLDALNTLGLLYFTHGMNAKGLAVYETLQKKDKTKALELINHYGAYLPFDPYRAL